MININASKTSKYITEYTLRSFKNRNYVTPWGVELLLGPGFVVAGNIKLLRLDAVEFCDELGWEDSCVGEGCFTDE